MINKLIDKLILSSKTFNFKKLIKVRKEKIIININSSIELWRSRTYNSKEPETLNWIDRFKKKNVFFDIGANIGLYSLYAAKKKCDVYAFEPASNNYSSLIKNIESNKLNIHSYGIGLSNKEKLSSINLVSTIQGDSQHNLNRKQKIYSRDYKLKQGLYITTIDNLVYSHKIPTPHHIKIDVDGHEKEIIMGAKRTLKSKKIKSLMIEINYKNKSEFHFINSIMKKSGFKLKEKSKRVYSNKFIKAQNFYFEKNF